MAGCGDCFGKIRTDAEPPRVDRRRVFPNEMARIVDGGRVNLIGRDKADVEAGIQAPQRLDLVALVEIAKRPDVDVGSVRRHLAKAGNALGQPQPRRRGRDRRQSKPPLVAIATRGVSRVAETTARSRSSRARST